MSSAPIGPIKPDQYIPDAQLDWRIVKNFENILTIEVTKSGVVEDINDYFQRVKSRIRIMQNEKKLNKTQIISYVKTASSNLQERANKEFLNSINWDRKRILEAMMDIYTAVYNSCVILNEPRPWLP